jgi:NTE family protein
MSRQKIGLALGGGGARGLAHIGVLRVFHREKIPIDIIVGTSIGAIIGGLYAQKPDILYVEEKARAFANSDIYEQAGLNLVEDKKPNDFFGQIATFFKERIVINIAASKKSIVSIRRLMKTIEFALEDKKIEDTLIKFACVATDLINGKEVVFSKGKIREAVLASSAIPGFFPPVPYNNYLFTDGAVISPVPVDATRKLGADIVIGIDVRASFSKKTDFDNVIEVMNRANIIGGKAYAEEILKRADVIIQPEIGNIQWNEFKRVTELINAGEIAAEKKIGEIKAVIKKKKVGFFRRILKV